jgi:hypothetical protein
MDVFEEHFVGGVFLTTAPVSWNEDASSLESLDVGIQASLNIGRSRLVGAYVYDVPGHGKPILTIINHAIENEHII